LINPQNSNDNECFKWCISAYHTREEALKANRKPPHLNEIRRLRRNADIANFNKIKFPATLHDIDKFEEINLNYAINIFRPVYKEVFGKIKVDIDPLHISERNYQVEHMIDLLYLTEGEESLNDRKNPNDIPEELRTHYVLITDFTRLMRKWNNHHGKKYFCRKCLRFPYSRLDLLQEHILTCPGPNKASQRLILPEEAVSYGYTIHCSDGTTQKPVINRESENIIKDLMENLQEDLDVFDPETKKYLGASHKKCHGKKPMIQGKLDDEQKKTHNAYKKCMYCKTQLPDEGKNK
ncbi:16210_t:CDS:2, partial [Racocetra fulgida]